MSRSRTDLHGFAIQCITALLSRRKCWSGKRVSNSRPQPWQGCALPNELNPQMISRRARRSVSENMELKKMEAPPGIGPGNKGFADLRLTTWLWHRMCGAVDGIRTRDIHLGKVALYHWATTAHMVPWGGIEPPTLWFSVTCSTYWATKANGDAEGARTLDLQRDRLAF